jgi:nucleotide-binding universal stress UspA family protein
MTQSADNPSRINATDDSRPDTQTIIVAFDGSPSSILALERGIVLAEALKTRLRLIMTWTFPVTYGGYPVGVWTPEEDARSVIEQGVASAFPGGAPAWFSTEILQGICAERLITASKGAELLIVGSRGHGGFAGLLLGSVSSAVAEHAHCPVLVMHTHPSTDTEAVVTEQLAALLEPARATAPLDGAPLSTLTA